MFMIRTKRILLINPNKKEHAGRPEFKKVARKIQSKGFLLTQFKVDSEPFPKIKELENFDGIISLGSAYNFEEELQAPWSKEFIKFMDSLISNLDIPLLAICYSAQASVLAFGGTLNKLKRKEVGYSPVVLTRKGLAEKRDGTLLKNLPDVFFIGQNYNYGVIDLPSCFTVLGANDLGIQLFSLKRNAFFIQGHPEMDDEWVQDRLKRAAHNQTKLSALSFPFGEKISGPRIFDNFLDLVKNSNLNSP